MMSSGELTDPLTASFFQADGVQRDIQCSEQVGQGLWILPSIRHGPIVLYSDRIP
jgi:hypothetical protein